MAGAPKNNPYIIEVDVRDLPPNLDALKIEDGFARRNLQPSQVFKEHPTLSMIAQVVADYITTKFPIEKQEISILIHQDSDMAAITFEATAEKDGSVNSEIDEAIEAALADFERAALNNDLQADVGVALATGCIGGRPDKLAFIDLLRCLSEEQGFNIGPTAEGSNRKYIGAFTLEQIEESALRDKPPLPALVKDFLANAGGAVDVVAPEGPHVRAQEIGFNFAEILDAVVGAESFSYFMRPHKSGYRFVMWDNEGKGHIEKIQAFYDSMAASAAKGEMPQGVTVLPDDWMFRFDDTDSFQRLYEHVVDMYGVEPPKPIEQDIEEQEEKDDLFWNRVEAVTAPSIVCDMLYGLGRHRYRIDDNVDWTWEKDEKGVYHFAAKMEVDDFGDSNRLQSMMRDIVNHGGSWQDLGICSNPAEVHTTDLRMLANALELYAKEKNIKFGVEAIEAIEIAGSLETVLFGTDTELKADPSLISGLGKRMYSSRAGLLTDIEKLLRARDTGVYICPHTIDDLNKAIGRDALPKQKPAPAGP